MPIRVYLKFLKPLVFLFILIVFGTSGYLTIENWSLIDSLYMTVITVTTVGFGEVHTLSNLGKLFTIILVTGGVGFYAIGINVIFTTFLESGFRDMIEQNIVQEKIKKLKGHYIICGGGRMSHAIAREFVSSGQSFVIIENNAESVVSQKKNGWLILMQDALLEESLILAGIERAKGLAAVLPTDADNLFVVLSARRLKDKIRIETRIAHESSRSKMLQAGADRVVSPYVLGGIQMARSFIEPSVDEFLEIILDKSNYEFEMTIHQVKSEDPIVGKEIRDTPFRDQGLLIIGIKDRDTGLSFAPDSDFIIKEGHEILLMGPGKEKPLE
ncbi:MAG: potassium channel protein [Leptospirales bacterium]